MKLGLTTEFQNVDIRLNTERDGKLDDRPWFRVVSVITALFLSSSTSPL
jgi:hypothetical protein